MPLENNREFDVLLEEYKTLKSEINTTLISVRQSLTLCLTGIGGLIAISPFIVSYKLPTLFLVSSMVFQALVWNQLRQYMTIAEIATYLKQRIIPRIRKLLQENSQECRDFNYIMSWEGKFVGLVNAYGLRFSIVESSDMIIPVIGSLSSFSGYFILSLQVSHPIINIVDVTLSVINLIAISYTFLAFIWYNKRDKFRKIEY